MLILLTCQGEGLLTFDEGVSGPAIDGEVGVSFWCICPGICDDSELALDDT